MLTKSPRFGALTYDDIVPQASPTDVDDPRLHRPESKMIEEVDGERCLQEMESDAQIHAQHGDNSKMIALLRRLYRQEEIPDLNFIADLLEKKPKKSAGRPADLKILAGVKTHLAGLTVHDFIVKRGLTVELALEETSRVLPMSVSSIKRHYRRCVEVGVVPKIKKVAQKKQGN